MHVAHLVAAQRRAVPAAVLADEGTAPVGRRQVGAGVEPQAQRGNVRGQRVVGLDRLSNQVGPLGTYAMVDVLAVVAVGPAVEAALLHRRHVVGHEVGADLVALVDDGPEPAGARLPLHAGRIAQPGGEHAARAGGHVDLQDGRATVLHRQTVLGDVAVGADADVELPAVAAGQQRLGPVVVDGVGQIGELAAGIGDAGGAGRVGVAHDPAGVRDVERVADQLHAEGRVQALQEDVLHPAAGTRVPAQQRDAVAALAALAGAALDEAGDKLLGRGHRLLARTVGLDDQHVAVGQRQQLARMLEAVGDLLDLQAGRDGGVRVALPADAGGHLHRRHQEVARRRQDRIAAGLLPGVDGGALAAGAERDGQHGGDQERPGSVFHARSR